MGAMVEGTGESVMAMVGAMVFLFCDLNLNVFPGV